MITITPTRQNKKKDTRPQRLSSLHILIFKDRQTWCTSSLPHIVRIVRIAYTPPPSHHTPFSSYQYRPAETFSFYF